MRSLRVLSSLALASACAATLVACSAVDHIVWGSGGANVIATTESLIEDLASDLTSDLVCDDFTGELGTRSDWDGLSAGEPEQFIAEHWDDQAMLGAQWNINLEGTPKGATAGDSRPGDVFYRETDTGLCAVNISWSTVLATG